METRHEASGSGKSIRIVSAAQDVNNAAGVVGDERLTCGRKGTLRARSPDSQSQDQGTPSPAALLAGADSLISGGHLLSPWPPCNSQLQWFHLAGGWVPNSAGPAAPALSARHPVGDKAPWACCGMPSTLEGERRVLGVSHSPTMATMAMVRKMKAPHTVTQEMGCGDCGCPLF